MSDDAKSLQMIDDMVGWHVPSFVGPISLRRDILRVVVGPTLRLLNPDRATYGSTLAAVVVEFRQRQVAADLA